MYLKRAGVLKESVEGHEKMDQREKFRRRRKKRDKNYRGNGCKNRPN